jgi:DNA-binding response OmpR family regulator
MEPSKEITVLLIDDDRTILVMYADFLRKHGFVVFSAQSAEEGLALLIEHQDAINIVVTDIMMARMNGWQFLDYVRKDMGLGELEMPVIVMSAVESVDLDMEYMRHRANDWVTKPVKPMVKLVHKIWALLGVAGPTTEENCDAA